MRVCEKEGLHENAFIVKMGLRENAFIAKMGLREKRLLRKWEVVKMRYCYGES